MPGPQLRQLPLDGPLAIDPSAALMFWPAAEAEPTEYELADGVAIIRIEGPLVQRGGWWRAGYEDISARVEAAHRDPRVRALAQRITSPGGLVAGMFEGTARLRAAKKASGKPVHTYADGQAASAAYAIAATGDRITTSATGRLGSIGVLRGRIDASKALSDQGIKYTFIASGSQKLDGHAEVPLSPEERTRMEAEVNYLAGLFYAEVAASRGMTVEAVKALDGAVMFGPDAVAAGLADDVSSWEDTLALARAEGDLMKGIAALRAAIGASAEVVDEQVFAQGAELAQLGAQLVALTGKTPDEASGVVSAWKLRAARADVLEQAELARAQAELATAKTREDAERVQLVRGVVASGHLLPPVAYADPLEQTTLAAAYAEMSMPSLRAHVAEFAKLPAFTGGEKRTAATTDSKVSAADVDGARLAGVTIEQYMAAKAEHTAGSAKEGV